MADRLTRPTVPEVVPMVREYYAIPGNGNGGSLHIVLEDGNLSDSNVEWCRKWAIEHNDAMGERLAVVLGSMTRTQRARLAAMSHYPPRD